MRFKPLLLAVSLLVSSWTTATFTVAEPVHAPAGPKSPVTTLTSPRSAQQHVQTQSPRIITASPRNAFPTKIAPQQPGKNLSNPVSDEKAEAPEARTPNQRARSQIAKPDAQWGKLTTLGPNRWISSQGLIYDQGSRQGNRLAHVLAHAKPDPGKPVHSVYNVPENQVTAIVDEAWSRRKLVKPDRQSNGNDVYDIPMERKVGTKGEMHVRIVVESGTTRIITAFPVKKF